MSNSSEKWRLVNRALPCPSCQHDDWCAWSPDGSVLKCERSIIPPSGMIRIKLKDGGGLFKFQGVDAIPKPPFRNPSQHKSHPPVPQVQDWKKHAEKLQAAITPAQLSELASNLGVTPESLKALGVGFVCREELRALRACWEGEPPDKALSFPERDGTGRTVGLSLRAVDGRKSSPRGAKRGLLIPATLKDRSDPVLIVEGASDVAACECLQLAAVGRPSNAGGAAHLAKLLQGRDVLVVGENDQKEDGLWPGRDGALNVARRIASEWGTKTPWTLSPTESKDIRAWLQSRVAAGLQLDDPESCNAAGRELLSELAEGAETVKAERRPSQSELLVRLALQDYRIGLATGDEAFAVKVGGPQIALMFRGSRDALRSALSREFRRQYGTTPSSSALADALTALQGEAYESVPEPVALRIAEQEGSVVIDLGRADGCVVVIGPEGWQVESDSPVLFRRTALTGELPIPVSGGSLDDLKSLVNVSDNDWLPLVGWIVAAYLPWLPHPILMFGGLQGSGKSTTARLITGLIDPSPAPLRSQPKEPEQWALAAAGSWAVVIDNVSVIPGWWSDALCKASTGDGWVRRKLYTDSELSVVSFRRVVSLTSIDAGALRGDLGDRLLLVDLQSITPERRRTEKELDAAYRDCLPKILGAVFDLTAQVLAEIPNTSNVNLPRMADFAQVLAAMDRVLGSDALSQYASQGNRIASEVIEADPVGLAIQKMIEEQGEWIGTSGELLERIRPENPKSIPDWPKSARGLAGRIRRLIPALSTMDVAVVLPIPSDKARRYVIRRIAPTAQSPETGTEPSESESDGGAIEDKDDLDRPDNRPGQNDSDDNNLLDCERWGDSGGSIAPPSVAEPIDWNDPDSAAAAKARAGIDANKARGVA